MQNDAQILIGFHVRREQNRVTASIQQRLGAHGPRLIDQAQRSVDRRNAIVHHNGFTARDRIAADREPVDRKRRPRRRYLPRDDARRRRRRGSGVCLREYAHVATGLPEARARRYRYFVALRDRSVRKRDVERGPVDAERSACCFVSAGRDDRVLGVLRPRERVGHGERTARLDLAGRGARRNAGPREPAREERRERRRERETSDPRPYRAPRTPAFLDHERLIGQAYFRDGPHRPLTGQLEREGHLERCAGRHGDRNGRCGFARATYGKCVRARDERRRGSILDAEDVFRAAPVQMRAPAPQADGHRSNRGRLHRRERGRCGEQNRSGGDWLGNRHE